MLTQYTLSEYRMIDYPNSPAKYEYYKGQILVMPGALPSHNQLIMNFGSELNQFFSNSPCLVLPQDTKVYVPAHKLMAYPDLTIVCDPLEHYDPITIVNPTGIVEVLSSSTEQYDRTKKVPAYLSIPSIQQVALVCATRKQVEIFAPNSTPFIIENEESFQFLGCEILMKKLYNKIQFS